MRALLEAHIFESGVQFGIPGTQDIVQAIESLAQAQDLSILAGDDETKGLANVDFLSFKSPLRKADLTFL